jgi:predicted MPP superfamily phosphohydrolase
MTQWLRFAVFLTMGSAIIGGWHYYLWVRLVRDTQLPEPWRTAATAALALLAISMPLAMGLARSLPPGAARPVFLLIFSWMGLAFLLLSLVFAGDLVRIGVTIADRARGLDPTDPERRTALARLLGGAAALLGVGAAGTGVASAFSPVIERVKVPLARLSPALSGLRIVQLSDVHVGATIQKEFIARIVEQVNALQPDIIAITGDLVDGSVEALREHVAPLANLKARYGVFFVTGNHEYYSGAEPWVQHLTSLGIRVLRNERVSIGDEVRGWIDLLGVDDYSARGMAPGHRHDVGKAVEGRDTGRPCVLLAHQPRSIFDAARHGVSLQLSGHTHGGQIFPWNFLVRLQQPFVAGLDRHLDTWIYTHRGTGFWGPPMRVGASSEIAEITLVSALRSPALLTRPGRGGERALFP